RPPAAPPPAHSPLRRRPPQPRRYACRSLLLLLTLRCDPTALRRSGDGQRNAAYQKMLIKRQARRSPAVFENPRRSRLQQGRTDVGNRRLGKRLARGPGQRVTLVGLGNHGLATPVRSAQEEVDTIGVGLAMHYPEHVQRRL